jgi:hypothetical protein
MSLTWYRHLVGRSKVLFERFAGAMARPRLEGRPSACRQRFVRPQIEALESRYAPSCTPVYNYPWIDVNCTGGPCTVTVDHAGNFPVFNGSQFPVPDNAYNAIRIFGCPQGLTTNIYANVHPVTVMANHDSDTVNIGDASNPLQVTLQRIQASLFIQTHYNIVNVYDQGDGTFRTATIDTSGIYERIRGLGMPNQVEIDCKIAETRAVNLWTGFGGSTVNVLATGALGPSLNGPTTIFGASSNDTVNVGSAGSLQGIQGKLVIENPPNTPPSTSMTRTTASTIGSPSTPSRPSTTRTSAVSRVWLQRRSTSNILTRATSQSTPASAASSSTC